MLEKNVDLNSSVVLVTGAAGFIGSNIVRRLLADFPSVKVVGIDSMSEYYDVSLKKMRLAQIGRMGGDWTFFQDSIADRAALERIFGAFHPDVVVNAAAQAGVRNSAESNSLYIESNIIGFYNVLEACREHDVRHLVYASSSSVYGNDSIAPYGISEKADRPVSLYAATKRSDELLAHAYSKLYDMPVTGLRFFTVYGPAGRPDMAYYSFAERLVKGGCIQLFNYGNCSRDFTYIDDIVEGVVRVMQHAPEKSIGEDGLPVAPCKIYNIGNGSPVNLLDFARVLKDELVSAGVLDADFNLDSHLELVPMQAGDVPVTFADTSALEADFDYKPSTSLKDGLRAFAQWFANN